jgi:large conductance mechanosensitive channel
MAFVIFLFIKLINKITEIGKKPEEVIEEEPTTKQCPYCYSEIDIRATKCPRCVSEL